MVIFVLLGLFGREILFAILLLLWRPRHIGSRSRGSAPILYESVHVSDGLISFPCLFGTIIIVHPDLWTRWSSLEKEAVFHWTMSCRLLTGFWPRLFGFWNPTAADRAAVLAGASSLSLIAALENLMRWQIESHRKGGSVFSALSLTGPGLLRVWPSLQARFQRLTQSTGKLI